MSEFKTNKISPRSGTTQTIGDSGDSVSTSSGSTINNAGTITTAGITGGTINNTTGEIYLRGEVDWQPSDIKTASFTATDNQGFFVNTTSGQITVTLPASPSAGDVVGIKDYANTFDTNKCILNANGNKIQGSTELFDITVEGSSIIIIYVDATQGWVITDASKASDIVEKVTVATGGTITTCGDYKIHTFTTPGTFCVSCAGSGKVDYLVVAGGAGGGSGNSIGGCNGAGGGGGGAGGYRESHCSTISGCYTASPLATSTSLPITATAYPITIGGGGSGAPTTPGSRQASSGNNSIFSTITSAGGGGGGGGEVGGQPSQPPMNGLPGGSGGGSGAQPAPGVGYAGGTGNTPPVSPPQGTNGGVSGPGDPSFGNSGSSGGGAGSAGSNGNGSTGQPQSSGVNTTISGTSTGYAGGGGSGSGGNKGGGGGSVPNPFGAGKGGAATPHSSPSGTPSTAGIANTGSGGGGAGNGNCSTGPNAGSAGGSGIVIIRYKFQ